MCYKLKGHGLIVCPQATSGSSQGAVAAYVDFWQFSLHWSLLELGDLLQTDEKTQLKDCNMVKQLPHNHNMYEWGDLQL